MPAPEARRVVARRPPVPAERRLGARLPGGLAAHPGAAQRRRPLLGRDDRGGVHGRARHRQPPRRAPERAARAARGAAALRARRARDRRLRRREPASSTTTGSTRSPSRLPSPSLAGGLAHFAALLPPTLLMGMSLPLLVRAMLRDAGARPGRTIGYLYGINMLGAAAGAFAAPWLLIPRGGIAGAVARRRGRQPARGRSGALALARERDSAARRRAGPPPGEPIRATPRAPPVRAVALALRALGLRGALARDPLVPPDGRGREVDRVHLRHRARDLPARLRGRLPGRGAARSTACAARSRRSCSASARSCCSRGSP